MNKNEINFDEINNQLLSKNDEYYEYIKRSSIDNSQKNNINEDTKKIILNNFKENIEIELDENNKDDLIDFFTIKDKKKRRKMKP